jgi:hypothetical protein
MYANRKMIPDESILGMRIWAKRRMVEGVNSSMIYLIHYRSFCNCYNVPPPSTTIKIKIKK